MFLRGKGCDLPQRTDLEFRLGVGETSLRTVDSELGSALGSWQPPGEACTGVASVTVTVQHTGSAWSDPGVSPAGRAGTWDGKRTMKYYWSKSIFEINGSGILWP